MRLILTLKAEFSVSPVYVVAEVAGVVPVASVPDACAGVEPGVALLLPSAVAVPDLPAVRRISNVEEVCPVAYVVLLAMMEE